jgi:hypothetical protein
VNAAERRLVERPNPVRERLYNVEDGTSADVIAKMLRVLFPDAQTVLDATWGTGKFWTASTGLDVVGLDLSSHGRPDVVADFRALPFADGAFDVVVFDPPYQWDEGKTKRSVMGSRFSTYRDEGDAHEKISRGSQEAWRVGRLGAIVKCQDYIHGSRRIRLSRWVEDAIGTEPFDVVHLRRQAKITDRKWTGSQLSAWSNSTTFLAFRHDGPLHRRRVIRSVTA